MDMHIEDWDRVFLSKYDPAGYVRLLKIAEVQTAMLYATSHVGCCYWPTKSGYMHKGLNGRDILGETVRLCHDEGMDVVLYYSLIFNNRVYEDQKEMRMVDIDGMGSRQNSAGAVFGSTRYGVCCPNSPEYRKFVESQVEELLSGYECEGIFFDMTYWPKICFCPNCEKRFFEETGLSIPKTADWNDAVWVEYQKSREKWLSDFAHFATALAKSVKPGISVEHNSATVVLPWKYGASDDLIESNDYIGGDLYGGWLQQSFVCKVYDSITLNRPFEYMTSLCCPNITDHTTRKSADRLFLHAFLSLAHGGAFLFIDAINPDGTQNPENYKTMGKIFGHTKGYEKYLPADPVGEVAVYFSNKSKYNRFSTPARATQKEFDISDDYPHLNAAMGAARNLKENHIPFRVICGKNLKDMREKVLVLPEVLELDREEQALIRDFVEKGGNIYVSGCPSPELFTALTGASFVRFTSEDMTYISPTPSGEKLMPDIKPEFPLSVFGKQAVVTCPDREMVGAVTVLPYTDPRDSGKFASIHSNPPGITTENPAILYTRCGEGKVIWVAYPIEETDQDPHKRVFSQLIDELIGSERFIRSDAPKCVELIALRQEKSNRYLLSAVNEQEQLPPVTVHDIHIQIKLPENLQIEDIRILPSEELIPFTEEEGSVKFQIDRLSLAEMYSINYRE